MLANWEIAIQKTGGYLYSRLLLGVLSAFFHYLAFVLIGVPYAIALALFVGLVSQFVPVVGTYIAGALPDADRPGRRPGRRPVGARLRPRVPADRELPVRAPHHAPGRCRCTRRSPSDR